MVEAEQFCSRVVCLVERLLWELLSPSSTVREPSSSSSLIWCAAKRLLTYIVAEWYAVSAKSNDPFSYTPLGFIGLIGTNPSKGLILLCCEPSTVKAEAAKVDSLH